MLTFKVVLQCLLDEASNLGHGGVFGPPADRNLILKVRMALTTRGMGFLLCNLPS
jgi:hypothetical protein